jgi:hypothetical protein
VVIKLLSRTIFVTRDALVNFSKLCHAVDYQPGKGAVQTPAEVIGLNVKALRESRMTAEEFGKQLGEILGKPWPRQMVYSLEKGGRSCTAEDVIAIAMVLDIPIADLFIPSTAVEEVQVGQRRVPRERLLMQGEKLEDRERLSEVARHVQALRRSFVDVYETITAQQLVIANVDRALRGEAPEEAPPESHTGLVWETVRRDFVRAEQWYKPQPPRQWLMPDLRWNAENRRRFSADQELKGEDSE